MTDDQPDQDRRQLILPHVDTSPSISGKTFREWKGYFPAGLGLFAALLALLMGLPYLAGALFVISALGLVFLGVHLEDELSESWYLTPRGIIKDHLSYRRFKRELPWGFDAAKRAALHCVRRITPAGSYQRHDGSRAALLRVDGTNMGRLPMDTMTKRVHQHTNAIDEELAPADQWWAFYSTTRGATSDPHIGEREGRANDSHADLSDDHRDILGDTANWLRERDAAKDANEWRDYVVVEVHPSDPAVELPNRSLGARVRAGRDTLRGWIGACVSKPVALLTLVGGKLPFGGSDEESASADAGETRTDDETTDGGMTEDAESESPMGGERTEEKAGPEPPSAASIEEVLAYRVDLVSRAIERVEGVEVERASPAEHINVLRSFWTNRGGTVGQAADGTPAEGGTETLLQRAFQRDLGVDGTTPTERMLAAGTFDVDGETVELAGAYCRTFWIAGWPVRPGAMFLDELFTFGGIDMDVKIHATPLDQYAAADEIEEIGLDVGAETVSRADQSDFGALSITGAQEAYEEAYTQLTNSNTDAWYLNGYVTVRAPDEDTLNDVCEAVTRRLEANPAGCTPVAPTPNQQAALASASPAGTDLYAEEANGERRHLALSGALGAMFPFGSTDLSEADGIFWGRDTRTGQPIVANPFTRGRAPHLVTIGMSRSGKTTFINDRVGDWYLAGEDRTLIVTDMESGFGGLTSVCGGKHIVIDGNDPVNPWHIAPVSEERRRQTDDKLAPLAAQINFVTELTMNVVRAGLPSGVVSIDPDMYRITRYAVGLTYHRAGITSDLETHSKQSPTYDDFFDSLELIRDNPEEHTIRGTEGEQAAREEQAEKLLERLIELTDRGQYAHLRGTGTTNLLDNDVSMGYLDMPQLQGSSDAAKSIGLQIALQQISQKIKRTPGPTIFVIDEAHVLYGSEEMIDWLTGAARRWARYDAAMWSVSQSPEEFVNQQNTTGDTSDVENKRQAIIEQASTMQAFYADADASALQKFGLESSREINEVQNSLTLGKSGGYSECLINFDDQDGWLKSEIHTSPVTSAIEAATSDVDEASEQSVEPALTTIEALDGDAAHQLAAGGIETREELLSTDAREVAALTSASGERIDTWYDAALARNGTDHGD